MYLYSLDCENLYEWRGACPSMQKTMWNTLLSRGIQLRPTTFMANECGFLRIGRLVLNNMRVFPGERSSTSAHDAVAIFHQLPSGMLHCHSLIRLSQAIIMFSQPIHPLMIAYPHHSIPLRRALFRGHDASEPLVCPSVGYYCGWTALDDVDWD